MRRILLCFTAPAPLLAGCVTFADTPAQQRTYAALEACKALKPANREVVRVEPDGRWWSSGMDIAAPGLAEWKACVRAGGPGR